MPGMLWRGSILVGLVGLGCTPVPQTAVPTPVMVATPAEVVATGEADTEVTLAGRLCGGRTPCAVRRTRRAGVDAGGQALTVVSLDLGAAGDDTEGLHEEAWSDNFSPAERGRCRPIEYWLVVGELRAPTKTVQLLQVCNEGNGAHGLGEDTVTIADNRFEHGSSGGSNWRWSRSRTVMLAPLRVREASVDGAFALGSNRELRRWSFDRFAGDTAWYSPPCDPSTGEPVEVAEASQVDLVYAAIPAVVIDAAFASGWQQTGLGRCALTVAAADRATDATLRVVADATTVLYVELEDDHFTRGDQLELWFADAAAGYMDHCLASEAAGLRQWTIGVSDGRVLAGHGGPEVAALTVERSGASPLRLRISPRAGFAALGVVYLDRDDGEATPLRLATSALVPGRRETLGRLETIDPLVATCEVVAGRLEPVLHAFAGPGPLLQ